ncbi:hypothetical protein KKG90_09630 [Candidatus Bipolaricaulota bacterium]|nr:hypothetical protein [Candidatus Bipolaricaulota bacterium]
MRHFTFSWGTNYIAVRGLLKALGQDLATPPAINTSIIEQGIHAAHPFLCFSGKLVLGQLHEQIRQGEQRMVFMSSLGPEACRCADTSEYMTSLFGPECPGFSSHRIGGDGVGSALENLRSHFGQQVRKSQCVRAYAMFFGKVDVLDKIAKSCTRMRCLSSGPSLVQALETEALSRTDRADSLFALWRTSRWLDRAIAKLPRRSRLPALRIGVVGGEHILSELGTIMQKLRHLADQGILLDWRGGFRQLARADERRLAPLKRSCSTYLQEPASTSEIFSCAHALDFIHEGYDGLLHVYAFGCMPQTSLKPILQRIAQDSHIPLLSLAIGERFTEEGLDNRLEAFVDLLSLRKNTDRESPNE